MTALQRRAVYLRSVASSAWDDWEMHFSAYISEAPNLTCHGACALVEKRCAAVNALRVAAIEADRCLGRDMIRRAVEWGA